MVAAAAGVDQRKGPFHHGPGLALLLLTILLLGGMGVLVLRSSGSLLLRLSGTPEARPCSTAMNRWANQRIRAARAQMQQEHGLYRAEGKELNAITAMMNWLDDRIIDQRVGEVRRRLRAGVLHSARCLPLFRD